MRACGTSQDVNYYTSLLGWHHEHSPLLYTARDALVSVSTADKCANADKVYSKGIGLDGNENISVRGHNVEVKSELLFLRVTYVIKDQNEMKEHLKHEFGNKSPSLFDKGVMGKNTKSTCYCWCIEVKCHSIVCASSKPYYFIDGGQLLYRIKWSTGMIKYVICM